MIKATPVISRELEGLKEYGHDEIVVGTPEMEGWGWGVEAERKG